MFFPSVESQKVGQEEREGESQSSKRSRSSGSDSDSGNQQVKKKARIVDSDSDDDETPQAAAATGMCRTCLWLTSGSQAQAPSLARTLDLTFSREIKHKHNNKWTILSFIIFKTNCYLMQVKSNAECSKGSIL